MCPPAFKVRHCLAQINVATLQALICVTKYATKCVVCYTTCIHEYTCILMYAAALHVRNPNPTNHPIHDRAPTLRISLFIKYRSHAKHKFAGRIMPFLLQMSISWEWSENPDDMAWRLVYLSQKISTNHEINRAANVFLAWIVRLQGGRTQARQACR